MPSAMKTCSCVGCLAHHGGCPELVPLGTSRCDGCAREAERTRGTAAQRGYDSKHERAFRARVLARDPICVCTEQAHGHGPRCYAPSAHADHHPRTRRELVALRLDADDPQFGRGLCHRCHSKVTAAESPGGWHGNR